MTNTKGKERYEDLWNKSNAQMGLSLYSFQKLIEDVKKPLLNRIKKMKIKHEEELKQQAWDLEYRK